MNKQATIDFATTIRTDASAITPPAHTQALLDLVSGEARDSFLAVHDVLRRELPPGELAIYEAGGGSCSFLPLEILNRSHVTVVEHLFSSDRARTLEAFREELDSSSFDARRRVLAA